MAPGREEDSVQTARARTPNRPAIDSVIDSGRVQPIASPPPPSTSDVASSSTQSSSSEDEEEEEDDVHHTDQQARRRPLERSRLFRPARVTSPGESQSRDLSPIFLPFASSHDRDLSQSAYDSGERQRDHDTTAETQRLELRDTLRSPQRAKAAVQPDISKTTHSTNQASDIGSRASIKKTYTTQKDKDAGSTAPSLGEVADPSTPSMGSSFSDLDSMSRGQQHYTHFF